MSIWPESIFASPSVLFRFRCPRFFIICITFTLLSSIFIDSKYCYGFESNYLWSWIRSSSHHSWWSGNDWDFTLTLYKEFFPGPLTLSSLTHQIFHRSFESVNSRASGHASSFQSTRFILYYQMLRFLFPVLFVIFNFWQSSSFFNTPFL